MKHDKNSNIVRATYEEILAAGYSPVKPIKDKKGNIESPAPGSLLCLVNKGQDLWAELSPADIKISKVTADKFLIMEKK